MDLVIFFQRDDLFGFRFFKLIIFMVNFLSFCMNGERDKKKRKLRVKEGKLCWDI